MKQVCILDDYQNAALESADWSVLDGRVAVTIYDEHVDDEAELVRRLQAFDIVVAMRERTPITRSLLEQLPQLELIATTGMHNAAIDLQAAAELGVGVCGTGGLISPTVEMTWGLILACVKQIPRHDRAVKDGGWQQLVGGDLAGARLGVIGLGHHGSVVAQIGKAFSMDVVAWSQNMTSTRCEEVGVDLVSKEELFACSDVVTVHLVLSPRTTGLVSAPELARMKPTSYLVNTSRGPIVDEADLVSALRDGSIAGAGLDVFDHEPLAPEHPLRKLDNVILSPHMGYVSKNCYAVFYGEIVENIASFLDGKVIRAMHA